jgi:hypothetical protein
VQVVARSARCVASGFRRGLPLPRVQLIERHRTAIEEPNMNTTLTQRLIERGTALILAIAVTVSLLGGIDALAAHDVQAGSLLVQRDEASHLPG